MFKQILIGHMENFGYVLGCDRLMECAFVDPAWEEVKLFDESHGYKLTSILITHTHSDHTEAVGRIKQKHPDVKIYVHENSAADIPHSVPVKDGDTITVGEQKIKVIHTPGHTKGSICYLHEGKLLTGDTLFISKCGRCDFAGGSSSEMYNSLINVIGKLPRDTEIYPGHDYGGVPHATIAHELKNNPYYLCKDYEEFYKLRGGNK